MADTGAFTELSGNVSGNSGDIATLQTQMFQTRQDLLQRPDLNAYDALKLIHNQSLNDLTALYNSLAGTMKTMQNLYTSMSLTLTNHIADFTGFTGIDFADHVSNFTGFSGWHTGQTTGDGVHGHTI